MRFKQAKVIRQDPDRSDTNPAKNGISIRFGSITQLKPFGSIASRLGRVLSCMSDHRRPQLDQQQQTHANQTGRTKNADPPFGKGIKYVSIPARGQRAW